MEVGIRYQQLLHPFSSMTLERSGDRVALHMQIVGAGPRGAGRHNSEFGVAKLVHGLRELSRVHVVPCGVWFPHSAPTDTGPLVEYFGTAQLRFGAETWGASFDSETCELRTIGADPRILSVIAPLVEQELQSDESLGALERVRAQVSRSMAEGEPNLEHVAAKLGRSSRSLQRLLHDAGTSFQALVKTERRTLAERYLRDGRLDTDDVAMAMGYAPEAFRRAFKQWTGLTPGAFRRGRQATVPPS
jgi:AraC-like DNA-binding protein